MNKKMGKRMDKNMDKKTYYKKKNHKNYKINKF